MIIILYALLSYGVSIPLVILPNFKAEQLYIKLDKKLILQAKQINVSLSNIKSDQATLFKTPQASSIINFARKNFQSLKIDTLYINGHKVTFSYIEQPLSPLDNRISITSDEIQASIFYQVYKEHITLDIPYFIHKPSKVTIRGKSLYDLKEGVGYSQLTLSLPDCTDIELFTKENGEALAFSASSTRLKELKPIVELFKLPENISRWIVDHNNADSYELLQAKGIYSYSNPQRILDTVYLHAREKEVAYTFNKALSPVIAQATDVYFSKGVLDIRPSHARYNEHPIDAGGVSIDFNNGNIILKVKLSVNTTLEQDIVDIVQAYKIPLPLLQEKGKTEANLEIVIDLWTEKAYAKGQFFVKKSDLILDGIRYKVKNAAVRLHKNFLTVDTVNLAYEEMLLAAAHGQMDLKNLTGGFFFDVQKASLPLSSDKKVKLLSQNTQIQLRFLQNSESYILPTTLWSLDDLNITVEPSEIIIAKKFDTAAHVNNMNVRVHDMVELNVSGSFDAGREYADLSINATGFNYVNKDLNISALDSNIPFKLSYENNLTRLYTSQKNRIFINENQLDIMPTSLLLQEGILDINNTRISINNKFSSTISGRYNPDMKKAKITASHTMLSTQDLLFIKPPFDLLYEERDKRHHLDINSYGIHAVLNEDNEFDLSINDFALIHPFSKTMQLYGIKNGHANFTVIDQRIGMDLILKDFHPLLSQDGINITDYSIKGDYQNETANLQINKRLDLLYRKKGKLTAKNIDFNLFPILDYLEQIDTQNEKNDLDLIIKTEKCNVFLGKSGRKILSDSINIHIKENKMDAQLVHGKGGILFESRDKNISVFGRGLNDTFMNQLFKFSTFKGGQLSFVMQGTFDNMKGLINVNKTVIKDYTVLNNTLAFFNTIPSLITFSVPSYSKAGLYVDEMYASFDKTGSKIDIKDAKISSKELIITAKGETDFDKENIEMLMQVKTDLGSSAKNIPIIGYIIFGDDSISTTVRVHGPLSNPKVENSMAKSIIVAPFNIIKRTITLPFKALDILDEAEETKND